MLIGNEPADLKLMLMDSAQCFRWERAGDSFGAVINGKPVWLKSDDSGIHADGECDIAYLRRYLDLERDYSSLAGMYAQYPAAANAITLYPGLRVLNQEPWEALVSFIMSANNNVSRIRGLVMAIMRRFGTAFHTENGTLYSFPEPSVIAAASLEALTELRMGYRAPYLKNTATIICEGFPIETLSDMPYEEAHKLLTTLPGVGDKVADCVLLFGCEHASAFPVDVWVERLMRSWFGAEGLNRRQIKALAREKFGDHAGLLQQFLFHAARTGAINV